LLNARWVQGSISVLALGFVACTGGVHEGDHDGADAGTNPSSGAGGSTTPAASGGSSSQGSTATGGAPASGHSGHGSGGGDVSSTGGTGGTDHAHAAAAGEGDGAGSDDGEHDGHSGATGGTDGSPAGGTGGSHASGEHTGGSSAGADDGDEHEGTGGSDMHGSGGSGGSDAMGGMSGTGGSDAMGGMSATGGSDAMGGMGAMGGSDATGGTGAMGAMGGSAGMAAHDHCVDGEMPDARDALLSTPSAPDHFTASNGDIDLPLPGPVLAWMDERVWKPSHDAWHNIRRCGGATGGGEGSASSSASMCAHTELVPEHQECADAENGYEFLVMHRHMLLALRQAFPAHADLFDGFPHFPFEAKDVPVEWQSRFGSGWASDVVNTAKKLEDIEHHLGEFATEGDLGKYIQCGLRASGASSIHGAMHFKWVVSESPNSLGKQAVNLGNYMFWKLHGWIDGIWERYRVAKGLPSDESKLKDALTDQCREMHALGDVIDPNDGGGGGTPLPDEHGFFHENVRPAFERVCVGCHSESSPEAGMSLAGQISSADIVLNLVNVQTFDGGQFKRIVPGHPEQSWVYLKASGLAADAGCVGDRCITQPMPPGATADGRLTSQELDTLKQWILDGAPGPTD
jgi:hypothetical protein